MLYHITDRKNTSSIVQNGLKAKDGYVFLFEKTDYPYCEGFFRRDKWSASLRLFPIQDIIAKNQLFVKDYALFEVDVDGLEVLPDVCGEEISKFQFKVPSDIPSDKVKYVGDFSYKNYWDYPKVEGMYERKGVIRKIGSFGFIDERV